MFVSQVNPRCAVSVATVAGSVLFCVNALRAEEAPDAIAAQAFEMRMQGNANDAKAFLTDALAKSPNDGTALFELARVCFYLGDFDAAQKHIDIATTLEPRNPRFHYWAGLTATYRVILSAKRPETHGRMPELCRKSFQAYQRALALKPDYDAARVGLVGSYARLPQNLGGDREKAEQLVEEAKKLGPVSYAKARADILDGKEIDAQLKMWQDILARNDQNADACEGLAIAYLRGKRLEKATDAITHCLAIDPRRSYLLLDLALRHGLAKQYGRTEQTIQQYLATEPPPCLPMQACATLMLTRVKQVTGDRQGARDLMEQAKELDDRPWRAMRRPPEALFVAP